MTYYIKINIYQIEQKAKIKNPGKLALQGNFTDLFVTIL